MKRIIPSKSLLLICFFVCLAYTMAIAQGRPELVYTVSMEQPATHTYQVSLSCKGLTAKQYDFKIPVWMPGYYQILNYANEISNLKATDAKGNELKIEKANHNTWRVATNGQPMVTLSYEVKATRSFVATNYLNEARGFIAPTGLFLHLANQLELPVTVTIKPYKDWNKVATGLSKVAGKDFTYTASNFDILYDSPILIGKLEEMPSFTIHGVPHYFIGYQLGDFDRVVFMNDLKKVVEAAVNVIGEIPFDAYTFIGIGPGGGGIEHLNSSAVAFSGSKAFDTQAGRRTVLSFLGHEYFHHYNAKRIRPIELGPFDYDHGSRTTMLWVAEGITTYYDEMLLRWANLESAEDIFKGFQKSIRSYELSPGRLFQSVSQASYDTWADGPFGRTTDEVNKTVSYYEKGPVLGMMLDLKIRHETKNKKSLDDVMRTLYNEYYKKLKRGYTEQEFRKVCEQIAGTGLEEFFSYVFTVKTPDYAKYLAYAGLDIDTAPKVVPGAWLGVKAQVKNDSLVVREVEWQSPAWKEGIRRNQVITKINGENATLAGLNQIAQQYQAGDLLKLEVLNAKQKNTIPLILGTKTEIPFEIKRKTKLSPLQQLIQKSWLKE